MTHFPAGLGEVGVPLRSNRLGGFRHGATLEQYMRNVLAGHCQIVVVDAIVFKWMTLIAQYSGCFSKTEG
jgi:hypothetical protein